MAQGVLSGSEFVMKEVWEAMAAIYVSDGAGCHYAK